MSEIFGDELLLARSFENGSVGLVFVIKTTLMVVRSQHSSSLVAQFIKFFVSCRLPQYKRGILHRRLIFSTSFINEKANEETGGLLQFSRSWGEVLKILSLERSITYHITKLCSHFMFFGTAASIMGAPR